MITQVTNPSSPAIVAQALSALSLKVSEGKNCQGQENLLTTKEPNQKIVS